MQLEWVIWAALATVGGFALSKGLSNAQYIWSQWPALQWVMLIVFGGVGALALAGGLYWSALHLRLVMGGRAAQGKVVGQRAVSTTTHFAHGVRDGEFGVTQHYRTHTRYLPIVEFPLDSGELVRVEGHTDVTRSALTGAPARVYYSPQNPSEALIADFRQAWLGPLTLLLSGLVFLLCGLGGFVSIGRGLAVLAQAARSPEAIEQQLERDRGASGRYTVSIPGTVVRVEKLKVNGPALYLFICKGRRPGRDRDEEFQTDFFPFQLDETLAGRRVEILLDPKDPTAYYVPSGLLMQESVHSR